MPEVLLLKLFGKRILFLRGMDFVQKLCNKSCKKVPLIIGVSEKNNQFLNKNLIFHTGI